MIHVNICCKLKCLIVCGIFILLYSSQTVAQLPSILDPLYLSPIANPDAIPKFINPLPIYKNMGLRVDAINQHEFTVTMGHTQQDVLGTGQMTSLWGYGVDNLTPITYPGPTFIAKKDVPVQITYINDLGYEDPMPVDSSISYAFSFPEYEGENISTMGVPAVTHLHGGHTDWQYDGTSLQWFTPEFHISGNPLSTGQLFVTNVFQYDNSQVSNSSLWYHDHAYGIARLNLYLGLFGTYIVRDNRELKLIRQNKIPSGDYEIELAIQDRMFYPDGQLAYPNTPTLPGLEFYQTVQPEFFGKVIVVNGKAWPYLDVEPRKYRFRMLDASDSRFYHLSMEVEGEPNYSVPFKIIGSEQGLIPQPVDRNFLLMAPAERYDVVVDFSDPKLLGKNIILKNDANVPYPDGDPVDPNNDGLIMQFRVGVNPVVDPVEIPSRLIGRIPRLHQHGPTRKLLLFESEDEFGRLKPMVGTAEDGVIDFTAPVTEKPRLNDTEVWEIYNTTEDAHPLHLHLVTFQIINRQEFDAEQDPETGALSDIEFEGPPIIPTPEEEGWKDIAITYPEQVTRIIARFDKVGNYVWHCHIFSHSDHSMKRPFKVIDPDHEEVADNRIATGKFSIDQNFPNPFNPVTKIKFYVPKESHIKLRVFNILGEQIATLLDDVMPEGNQEVDFDAAHFPSGIYFYRFESNDYVDIKKMIVLK